MSKYEEDRPHSNFFLGMGLGAVIGLLFAPRSGKETRKRLKEDYDKYLEKGEDVLDEARDLYEDNVAPVVEKISDKAAPYVEVVKDVSEPYKEELMGKVREFIEETVKADLKKKKKKK